MLRTVGAELGWSTEIIVTGLPDKKFLEQTLDTLDSGTKSFTEIMDSLLDM